MLGPAAASRRGSGRKALEALRRYGRDHTRAGREPGRGAARDRRVGRGRPRRAPPRCARSPPTTRTCRSSIRADLEVGRGEFAAARAHLEAARADGAPRAAAWRPTTAYVAELALWERRWTDADAAVRDGLARARSARGRPDPRLALRQGTARAGGAGRARPRPPRRRRPRRRARARSRSARRAPARAAAQAAAVTPNAAGWRALAEAEHERAAARRPARPVVRRRGRVGPARAPAARRLLPLAPGRGARRRRRAARRRDRAAPGGPRRRRSASARSRCCASSSCSPSARGSISRRRTRARPDRTWSSSSD